MHGKQQDAFRRHQKNTGQWLLESPEFLNWLDGEDSNTAIL
jgi:hypothetical protein